MMTWIKKLLVLALCLWAVNVFAVSIAELEQHAKQGDAMAQAKLGAMYLLGWQGFEQNNEKAAGWIEKAAKQGLVDAEVLMGALYDRGLGVMADRNKATQWYKKAAAHGHQTSQAILGLNKAAKGSVQFSYQAMRLNAARSIPREYAKRFLMKK
ncbi:tetratricopeptide repeat protein [methane-oxidizing endosymbiont of Gigantopelta aegis]|uniref:tetratricopeptide repeat protein n=1 Tax=methane-oxidizing endosymbiont of Gigantopelta aegis TaxID=2794938 RepID=UPI001FDA6537|nr:tetratricopeptide repeat protein [methane-oxidizing endosymbiont of Gigantopelta aegis]